MLDANEFGQVQTHCNIYTKDGDVMCFPLEVIRGVVDGEIPVDTIGDDLIVAIIEDWYHNLAIKTMFEGKLN